MPNEQAFEHYDSFQGTPWLSGTIIAYHFRDKDGLRDEDLNQRN